MLNVYRLLFMCSRPYFKKALKTNSCIAYLCIVGMSKNTSSQLHNRVYRKEFFFDKIIFYIPISNFLSLKNDFSVIKNEALPISYNTRMQMKNKKDIDFLSKNPKRMGKCVIN